MDALDLTSRTANVIIHAQPAYSTLTNHPCGQSSAFVSDTLIALGRVSALLPGYGAGQILFVDSSNGRLVRPVPPTSQPIAVVALPLHRDPPPPLPPPLPPPPPPPPPPPHPPLPP